MSKSQMILFAALLTAMSAAAQQNQAVLLISSEKAVCYRTEAGTRVKNIRPGAVILGKNTLKVPRKSTAIVYSDGNFKRLPAGKHRLDKVMAEGNSGRKFGFDDVFESYLNASLTLVKEANGMNPDWSNLMNLKNSGDGWGVTDPKKSGDGWGVTDPKKSGDGWGVTDPKKSGDGWGVTDPKKSGDGWGGKGSSIHLVMPFGKVLPDSRTHFSWSRPAGAATYTLQIRDAANTVVHEVSTQDTFAVIDLSGARFTDGAHFIWQVRSAQTGTVLESNLLEFSIGNPADLEASLKPLQRSTNYADGDQAFRGIMEAVALERAEWFYAASQKYAQLKQRYPENNLLRMTYATFWMRYGMAPLAHNAVKQ